LYRLVISSLLMFTLPFATMYISYRYIKEIPGWTSATAIVPAAVSAIIVVYMIIVMFIFVAYKEEKKDASLKESLKKKE
uniref:DUF485 domain-containing protein n=1 Tax=Gongylonema pulchrum TaxID=637853 RepID=A0A183E6R2_9BILA